MIAGVAALWMMAIAGRLAWLQLFQYSEYLGRAQRQQQRVIEVTPRRGAIYDRNLHPMAMSIPVDSCFAVPAEISDASLASQLLSSVLGIPREVIEARLGSSRSFVWIARKLPPEKAQAIQALNLKGIYFQKENQRFYPKRDLAAHVLGYVDLDEKGLGGIEYELDNQILAKPEKILVMADAKRRWFDAAESQREPGASVVLTVDEKIQFIAERELAAAVAKTRAIAGTVIVQDPSNGQILAEASWPKFNPNAAGESATESHMNRAIGALYEPGSTFKLITLAAAFEEHITRPGEMFDCQNGAVYVAGHRIRDHKPFGLLTVSDILAQSSDVGAIKIALRLGAPKFYEYIRAFGFGTPTGIDLPGESRGLLRLPAARRCRAAARRPGCTAAGGADTRRAQTGDSSRDGGHTAAVNGGRYPEWNGKTGAVGRLDCGGQNGVRAEDRSGDGAVFAEQTDCFVHGICSAQQPRCDDPDFSGFARGAA